jgi:hypothetical protein
LNFFIASTMATFDWLARLGMLGPALPPYVPWQPAQAFASMAGVGGAACASVDTARTLPASAQAFNFIVIMVSSLV